MAIFACEKIAPHEPPLQASSSSSSTPRIRIQSIDRRSAILMDLVLVSRYTASILSHICSRILLAGMLNTVLLRNRIQKMFFLHI